MVSPMDVRAGTSGFAYKEWKGVFYPDDVPQKIFEHVATNFPDFLESPDDWDDGHPLTTWEAYARDITPENSPEQGPRSPSR